MLAQVVNLRALRATVLDVEIEDVGVPIHAEEERVGQVELDEDAFGRTGLDLVVVGDDAPGNGAVGAFLEGRAPIVRGDVVVACRTSP